jgi:hypothetical protein
LSAPARPRAARATTLLRAGAGAVLLARPDPLLAALGGRPPDDAARTFARALGARHLIEAALLAHTPTRARLRTGAAVDAVHAVTVAVLAERRHHRRLAAINAVSATGLAGLGLLAAG